VRFTAHGKSSFFEAERFHEAVVIDVRPLKFCDAQIDVIDAENFG